MDSLYRRMKMLDALLREDIQQLEGLPTSLISLNLIARHRQRNAATTKQKCRATDDAHMSVEFELCIFNPSDHTFLDSSRGAMLVILNIKPKSRGVRLFVTPHLRRIGNDCEALLHISS